MPAAQGRFPDLRAGVGGTGFLACAKGWGTMAAPVREIGSPDSSPELVSYRRNLPHWRLQGSIYFVTWRLRRGQPELLPEERQAVLRAIRHFDGQRSELFAWVVMNDHVHVLVKPLGGVSLASILHSWKGYTGWQIQRRRGRREALWQDAYFDRIVRDEQELVEKAEYILANPYQRWPEEKEYPWVGFRKADQGG